MTMMKRNGRDDHLFVMMAVVLVASSLLFFACQNAYAQDMVVRRSIDVFQIEQHFLLLFIQS